LIAGALQQAVRGHHAGSDATSRSVVTSPDVKAVCPHAACALARWGGGDGVFARLC
jgi:hypothetical protein